MTTDPEALLAFWFGPDLEDAEAVEARSRIWFTQSDEVDAEIARRFGHLPAHAEAGEFDAWRARSRSALARVIVLDQLPRNLYRQSDRAYRYDALALEAAGESIEAGFDRALHPIEASFFYLPFEHAEDLAAQERCVSLFDQLRGRCSGALAERIGQYHDYARRHLEVIRRFGRFPHRNALLHRESTGDELAYLKQGGETFGGDQGR